MDYDPPGYADTVTASVRAAWNRNIQGTFTDLRASAKLSRSIPFLLTSPDAIPGPPVDAVHWPGDPAEPRFCLNSDWAQKLSDWGVKGRHLFQNEYCEYALIMRPDSNGKVRPKRFSATTELAEWWTTVAAEDPQMVRQMAADVLGIAPSFADLYGSDVVDPTSLTPGERKIRFAIQVAGNGNHDDLMSANVPADPVGDLNTQNALFMSHPINGLDDLIYIVMFGAQPYAVQTGAAFRAATLHEIFRSEGVTHLACRNADPSAAQGAYDQVVKSITADGASGRGCQLAFANPIGVYIHSFNSSGMTYNGNPVAESWIRLRRGREGFEQRLEFGPSDSEAAFLDDVFIEEGAARTQLIGGYQLARRIEVGPKVLIGPERQIAPQWAVIPDNPQRLDCTEAEVCTKRVGPAKTVYEKEHSSFAPRGPM
jgi:hypothetical protein